MALRTYVLSLGLAAATTLPAMATSWTYPNARKSDHVDDYHGIKVADPYQWMEDLDSPETKAWVQAENKLTFGYLDSLPERAAIKERITKFVNYPKYGLPQHAGGRYFYEKNEGLQNQSVYYVQDPGAEPRVLIDPNTLSSDGTVALTTLEPSYDGKWLGYGTAAAGSDWNEFRVRDVDTCKDTGDVLKWVKFSGLSWTRDNKGFFYSRYPEGRVDAGTGKTFEKLEHMRVYYHRLGTAQSSDTLIFEDPSHPTWFFGSDVTDDGRYLILSTRRGDQDNTLLSVVDLKDPMAPVVDGPRLTVVGTWDAEYSAIGTVGSTLLVLTNLDAPKRRIVAIDLARPDRAHWKTVVPESEDTISSAGLVGGKLVAQTMHDVLSRLTFYSTDGSGATQVELPGLGDVIGFTGRQDDDEFFYMYTSYTQPREILKRSVSTGKTVVFRKPQVPMDPSDYVTEQVFYPSKDGTKVPLFITHKKGIALDGSHPTILYGYGGFDVSITPYFSTTIVSWIEMGGLYAVANLRGGGEYGKAWHEAGTKERKQNVFDDYIAAADWLCAHGYTSHQKLVLSGDSNGGLLVGAVLNQRPDLCAVAFPGVGVMDMLKFQKFTIGYAWVSDYGSSDTPEGFAVLRKYSPLHTIRTGVRYPAVLVTTADHDDRVYPAHSFKYTATLQAAVAGRTDSGPILIRIETNAGHGGGKPLAKIIDEIADKYAFAAHLLGMKP